jgi:hypothetical protein
MTDSMVLISVQELQAIIKSTLTTELAVLFENKEENQKDSKKLVYHSREYVKELLHTTYPTLNKYTKAGLLKPVYFGRKVLYPEDELNLALPKIKAVLRTDKRKAA